MTAAAAADSGAAGADLADAHARMLAERGLQFDFPKTPAPPETPDWLKALVRLLEEAGPLLKWGMWILLGVLAAGLLFLIVRELSGVRLARKRASMRIGMNDWRPDQETARRLLKDADELAEGGDYAAAAHMLLYRSIDDLSERRHGVVRPALTSREVAALDALPAEARPAFRLIASVVEKSFFGGAGVGRQDFEACRQAYADFALAERWT